MRLRPDHQNQNNSLLYPTDDPSSSSFQPMKPLLFDAYVLGTLNLVGFVCNALCIVIYVKLMRMGQSRGKMHKFLLSESIFETLLAVQQLVVNKLINALDHYYIAIVFVISIEKVAIWMSLLCKIGACLCRYLKVSTNQKKTNRCRRRFRPSFKLLLAAMLVFAVADFLWILYYLTSFEPNSYLLMNVVNSLFHNVATITCIFLINILTMIETRKSLDQKRLLTATTTTTTNVSSRALRIDKAKMNISSMVFISGLVDVLGHGLIFGYFIIEYAAAKTTTTTTTSMSKATIYDDQDEGYENLFFSEFYDCVAWLIFTLTYISNFATYMVFNESFRKCFVQMFCCCCGKLRGGRFVVTSERTCSGNEMAAINRTRSLINRARKKRGLARLSI